MSLMPKLLEINDELVRVREERDRLRAERDAAVEQAELWKADFEEAAGHATRRQDELRKACAERDEAKEHAARLQNERDQAVEHAARLHAELYATRKQLQDVCSAKPAEQSDLVRDVSHYTEAAEVDRPTEPQPEQDGVLVQEGWWQQADGGRVYVRPTNPSPDNIWKINNGFKWSDGARLYMDDGSHNRNQTTPHDLVKFLGKELQPAEPQQHPAEYTPPEGWRVLQYGELLQPGDHWVNWEGTVSRPDIQHGDGATVSGGRYIRWVKPQPQSQPEPQFKPYTFAAYIVGDKSQPDALRIVWATEDWIKHAKFSIVHRISDLQFSGNDTFTPDQFSVNLKIQ